jgi:hypothetical protein
MSGPIHACCPNPRCVNGEVRGGERGLLLCPDCRGRRARTVGMLRRYATELSTAARLAHDGRDQQALARLHATTLDAIELLEGSDA